LFVNYVLIMMYFKTTSRNKHYYKIYYLLETLLDILFSSVLKFA